MAVIYAERKGHYGILAEQLRVEKEKRRGSLKYWYLSPNLPLVLDGQCRSATLTVAPSNRESAQNPSSRDGGDHEKHRA
jgi:hypothetical protein